MKAFIILIASILFTLNVAGQNLLPNPSFELYSSCPNNQGQIENALYWTNPFDSMSSANPTNGEYYNSCGIVGLQPGWNAAGYQLAKSGNAFIGMYTFIGSGTPGREYIQSPLTDTLENGVDYYVEFSCAFADYYDYTHSCVGVLFIPDSLYLPSQRFIIQPPSVANTPGNMIQDTALWYTISGIYTANGTERYLCLGNFVADSLVDTIPNNINTSCTCAYFLFDDVIVSKITGVEEQAGTKFLIYPNPVNDVMKVNGIKDYTPYRIVDLKGSIIQKGALTYEISEIDVSSLGSGNYLLVLKDDSVRSIRFIKD